ncbi:RbAp48 [Toxoplasma gondii TgCatPRC2]|uniref:RbAp48 n=4 Tax=Toxoplasma gondii TaxID=5811 RepID=A0A151H649_TOXGO|nr:RbAp48 [Toxoplasma gondii ME49]EPT27780.1 RbAp48 [Toxoplasma gondii ME49]KYK64792.1 RbAp48 [Toxoplasma gondii TgCatPRC2]|eukprot:XP_002368611.2 RbAp48 [Toxoplasma gondii ME49]
MARSEGVGQVTNSSRASAQPNRLPTLRCRLRKKPVCGSVEARCKRRARREDTRHRKMGDRNSSTRRPVEDEEAAEMPSASSRVPRRTRSRLEGSEDSASHAPSRTHQKNSDGNLSEGDGSPGPGCSLAARYATEATPTSSNSASGSRESCSKRPGREAGTAVRATLKREEKKRQEGPESDSHGESAPPLDPSTFRDAKEGGPLEAEIFEAAHDGRAGPKHVHASRLRSAKTSRHRLHASSHASPRHGPPLDFSAPTSPAATASPSDLRDALPASRRLTSALHAPRKTAARSFFAHSSSRLASRRDRPHSVSPETFSRRRSTDSSEVSSCSGGAGDACLAPVQAWLSPSASSHRPPQSYLPRSACGLSASSGKKRLRSERRGKGGKRGKGGPHKGECFPGLRSYPQSEQAPTPHPASSGDEWTATRSQAPSAAAAGAPASAAGAAGHSVSAASLQGLYRANNRHWQNNCLLLYEHVMAHTLEWPSLTTQWMHSRNLKASGEMGQTLLVATHTSGPQHPNFLLLMEVTLPLEPIHPSGMHFGQRQDYVGFDFGEEDSRKFTVTCRIPHEGESNKARLCPSDQTKVASKALDGCVYIFDFCNFGPCALPFSSAAGEGAKHLKSGKARESAETATPADFMTAQAEVVLCGHTAEGWGLEWGPPGRENVIASAADDGIICVWDLHSKPQTHKRLAPLHKLVADSRLRPLQDVCWKRGEGEGEVLLGIGDDGYLNMWDLRVSPAPVVRTQCSWTCTNALAANANAPYVVATAGADKGVSIWDLRALRRPAHRLLHAHGEAVTCLKWAPGEKTTLASGSTDRLIRIFDLSLVGAEQESDEAEDGPPELRFVHGGHLGAVNDFDWNPQADLFSLMLASVSEDNALQIWQPTRKAFKRDSLFEARDGEDSVHYYGEVDGDDVE